MSWKKRALAAALASMVGNLTVGKKTYADVEDEVRASFPREKILANVQGGEEGFFPVRKRQ